MRRAIISDLPSSWSRIVGSVNAKNLTAPCPWRSSFLKRREMLVLSCKQEGHSCWRSCCHLWIFGTVYLQHIIEGILYRHYRPIATIQATESITIRMTSRDLAHSSKPSSGHLVGAKELQGATILRHDPSRPAAARSGLTKPSSVQSPLPKVGQDRITAPFPTGLPLP